MPRGGARPGAGRPKKSGKHHWLTGDAGRRKLAVVGGGRATSTPEASPAPSAAASPLPLPGDQLTTEAQQAWWGRLAPLALTAGTLTDATRPGFVLLCKVAARVDELEEAIDRLGLTDDSSPAGTKANPLLTHYRGYVQRQEQLLARYGLAAMSKPAAPPAPPESEEEQILRQLVAIK